MLHLGDLRRNTAKPADSPSEGAVADWPARFAELAGQVRDARLRDFYACPIPDGTTPLEAVPMLALDVETTGLDPLRDEILSIGAVPMDATTIRASASRYWIVRPRAPLNPESVTIHAITDSQIASAPDLADVIGELLALMAGRIVVVHCREIERAFLDSALRTRLGEGIEFPAIDTMALEARVYRRRPRGFLDRLLGRRAEAISIRLADSRSRYGLPRYRAHHAPTDALATAELLQAQLAHRYARDTPLGMLWS
ncbi:MAG: 3'-5' exonuclease [Rhodocyclaceae bacterium]|jgi:DNA polymerase-3 subunit epsilon|nr:3'-5' exonuclease [Rhodocyclaceae bacterium]MCL4757915.1 3'-5' exonuclease [Rhodocyclaceae bacterium]